MTAVEILKRILSYLTDYDTAVGSVSYDLSRPVAEEAQQLYDDNENTLKNAFALTAEGEYLDRKTAEQGIERRQAQQAEGVLTISGEKGAVVRVGSKAASGDLLFTVLEGGVIDESGAIRVSASCDTVGSIGNVGADMIIRFPVTLPGLTAVTNEAPFSGGSDEESDEQLRERYFDKVGRPNTSGNKYDYETWARSVSGVGAVKVIPLADGPGTVKVIISDSENHPADDRLINEVSAYIEQRRPIGACVTVISSKALEITVAAKIKHTGDEDTVIADIKNAVAAYLSTAAVEKGVVSYAKIGGIILAADSVEDYEGLKVNGGDVNIAVNDEYVPIILEVRNEVD